MNGLLSGLASSQGKPGGGGQCGGGNQCGGGGFGGNSIIWIIVLLFLVGGVGQGQQGCGTVCGCEKKHCKELCACGTSSGCGGIGGLGGLGSGNGCWWIIILLLLCFCGGNQNKKHEDICD